LPNVSQHAIRARMASGVGNPYIDHERRFLHAVSFRMKTIYIGPRGGKYHYIASGKRVYERKK
jgi:hypothetical protein